MPPCWPLEAISTHSVVSQVAAELLLLGTLLYLQQQRSGAVYHPLILRMGSIWHWRALGRVLKIKQHNSDVQIMASGGNMDWALEYARSNTRAEQTHILAAMIKLFETGINVMYSVDYTWKIDNFNDKSMDVMQEQRRDGRHNAHENQVQECGNTIRVLPQQRTPRDLPSRKEARKLQRAGTSGSSFG
jgi:hypothetical protein